MKIRSDYVSNSSSSSFIVFGKLAETSARDDNGAPMLTVDDVAALGEGEAYFIIIKDAGSEGDYIIPLDLDLMMDCDMRQINIMDINNITVIKARYTMGESGYLDDAKSWLTNGDGTYRVSESYNEDYNYRSKTCGFEFEPGIKMFKFDKDYSSPSSKYDILDALKTANKYHRNS